jgi:hypothetical protein
MRREGAGRPGQLANSTVRGLKSAGPGGPRLARRWAQRPRWSRTPGGWGDAGHVTSTPSFTRWALGGQRVDCRYREVTVPRRRGDAPQLCGLGSGRRRVCSLQRDLVIELFWHSVKLPLGKSAGGSRPHLSSHPHLFSLPTFPWRLGLDF